MIHNPDVNNDLIERGVKFLQDTHGEQLISFDTRIFYNGFGWVCIIIREYLVLKIRSVIIQTDIA